MLGVPLDLMMDCYSTDINFFFHKYETSQTGKVKNVKIVMIQRKQTCIHLLKIQEAKGSLIYLKKLTHYEATPMAELQLQALTCMSVFMETV